MWNSGYMKAVFAAVGAVLVVVASAEAPGHSLTYCPSWPPNGSESENSE